MQSPDRTPRQQVKDLLMAAPLSSRQLAKIVGITEREIEDHISHITQQVELLERLEPLKQLEPLELASLLS
jgi:DNA-binding CsgD family transcriptional regulator